MHASSRHLASFICQVGAMAAAVIASRRKNAKNRPVARPAQSVTPDRLRAKREALEKKAMIQELLLKYDKDNSFSLGEKEVAEMLTDLDNSTPPGTPPTQEELNFIMHVADWSENGTIEKDEVSYVVAAWNILTNKRSQLAAAMKEFDKQGNGTLNKEELTAYLTSLNEGMEVSAEEVDWVMAQADVFGDGKLTCTELVMASAAWFAHIHDEEVAQDMPAADPKTRGGMLMAEDEKIRQTFRKWDANGDGTISIDNLTTILSKTGVTDKQIQILFKAMDADQDGKVGYEEFLNYLFNKKS